MKEARIMMVIGMHRSGTSLVSQWLHHCGLHMGDRLLAADVGNKDGHYEDMDFYEAHERILNRRRICISELIDRRLEPFAPSEQAALATLVAAKKGAQRQWGFKDPRTCLFLPVYRTLLPDAYSLVIVRNFNDTVNSLVRRAYNKQEAKIKSKKGLSKWKWKWLKRLSLETMYARYSEPFLKALMVHYKQVLEYVSKLPEEQYLFVCYEDLLQEDAAYLHHFRRQWGFDLQHCSFSSVYKDERISAACNISPYIKDEQLLKQAEALNYQCQIYVGRSLAAVSEKPLC